MGNKNYVEIPVDLRIIKKPWLAGIPKRKCICYAIGLISGGLMFLLFYIVIGLGIFGGVIVLFIFSAPWVMCANDEFYYKKGMYPEKYIFVVLKYYKSKKKRLYSARNTLDRKKLAREQHELLKLLNN